MPQVHKYPCNELNENQTRLDWIRELHEKYAPVFDGQLGNVKGQQVSLELKEGATPKCFKARSVPFALRAGVEAELRRLEELNIISQVHNSEWASPIVPVRKRNGEIRICGDFRMALNTQLKINKYPLPRVDYLFASLAGGQKFAKIDMKNAYLQLSVHPDSRQLLMINTHWGLFRYNHMVFGISPAPAVWQRTMDKLLAGIPGTQCLLDDMLVTGKSEEEHKQNVEAVLQRLMEYGLKVNLDKCQFMQDRLEFCAHVIDKHGLHTTDEKVKALQDAPTPQNVTRLRPYLGL
ncbi:Hypothetical predicted protein [Pelobates cultripes]|uniref:ribonuclease H n=1 Tax=Pelobates cultripes TaxID=61616 RepID=A0AAD1S408_PELCU|nr:Hypothetical predicted protein [Pelobates cultripes]